jgi:hypothetical protein
MKGAQVVFVAEKPQFVELAAHGGPSAVPSGAR